MSKIKLDRWDIYGCECMRTTLPLIEADMIKNGVLKSKLDFFQGAYNKGVAASAATHWLGGVADTAQCGAAHRKYWKKWGVIDFERFPPLFGHHGHLIWVGCTHQHAQADAQEQGALRRGWNGLAGGASRNGEYFRVPDLTWQEAVKKYKPKPPPPPPPPPAMKGILDMTKPIYYHWAPAGGTLLPKGAVVWPILNADKDISVVGEVTNLVTVSATIGISGLAAGEYVVAAFELVDDFAGTKPTVSLGTRRLKTLTPANNVRTVHYKGRVPKSKVAGGTTKLRIHLMAQAKAAKLAWVQVDGLVSE